MKNFSYKIIEYRIRELAFLNPGLKLTLSDSTGLKEKEQEYFFEGGIKEYVKFLNRSKNVLHKKQIYFESEKDKIKITVNICNHFFIEILLDCIYLQFYLYVFILINITFTYFISTRRI